MASLIPLPNHRPRLATLISLGTQARSAQHEVSAVRACFDPEPAGGQHSHEMPARKQQHISLNRSHTAHHAVSPRGDLGRRFTSRTAIAEQLPIGALRLDLSGATALILPVVPLDEIVIP